MQLNGWLRTIKYRPTTFNATSRPIGDIMEKFKQPSMVKLVTSFLSQGFTVAYLDDNDERRQVVKCITDDLGRLKTGHMNKLDGSASMHYNVVIGVNPSYDSPYRNEWKMLPGISNGNGAVCITVEIDDS